MSFLSIHPQLHFAVSLIQFIHAEPTEKNCQVVVFAQMKTTSGQLKLFPEHNSDLHSLQSTRTYLGCFDSNLEYTNKGTSMFLLHKV